MEFNPTIPRTLGRSAAMAGYRMQLNNHYGLPRSGRVIEYTLTQGGEPWRPTFEAVVLGKYNSQSSLSSIVDDDDDP